MTLNVSVVGVPVIVLFPMSLFSCDFFPLELAFALIPGNGSTLFTYAENCKNYLCGMRAYYGGGNGSTAAYRITFWIQVNIEIVSGRFCFGCLVRFRPNAPATSSFILFRSPDLAHLSS